MMRRRPMERAPRPLGPGKPAGASDVEVGTDLNRFPTEENFEGFLPWEVVLTPACRLRARSVRSSNGESIDRAEPLSAVADQCG